MPVLEQMILKKTLQRKRDALEKEDIGLNVGGWRGALYTVRRENNEIET